MFKLNGICAIITPNFMEISCPSCRAKIATNDINVSTDVALCRSCGNTFRLSSIVSGNPIRAMDLTSPPAGAWYMPLADGFVAGATTRSWLALFMVPFTCVWSGGSLFGIYGMQIVRGQFSLPLSLFGIPFLLGSIVLISWCTMTMAGKIVVTRQADRLTVFTGLGPVGWSRNFSFSDFNTVREDVASSTSSRQGRVIRLEGKRAIAFGSLLSTERRYFLVSALQAALSGSGQSPVFVSGYR